MTPGRVDVGQLGQVADAHHDLGVGVAAARLEVAAQRRGEPEPDRLQDRVDAELDARSREHVDGAVEAVEVGRRVGDRDDFDAGEVLVPAAGVSTFVPLTLSTSSAPAASAASTSSGSKLSMETRKPSSRSARTASPTPAHARRGRSRGRSRRRRCRGSGGLRRGSRRATRRGVVDLGEDLDVVARRSRAAGRLGAEELGQVAQVLRAALGRHAGGLRDFLHSPRQKPGQDRRGRRRLERGRCRATQLVVMRAATVIGRTATSGSKPARGARSASTRRRAGSASLPVTNRRRGRPAVMKGAVRGLGRATGER